MKTKATSLGMFETPIGRASVAPRDDTTDLQFTSNEHTPIGLSCGTALGRSAQFDARDHVGRGQAAPQLGPPSAHSVVTQRGPSGQADPAGRTGRSIGTEQYVRTVEKVDGRQPLLKYSPLLAVGDVGAGGAEPRVMVRCGGGWSSAVHGVLLHE